MCSDAGQLRGFSGSRFQRFLELLENMISDYSAKIIENYTALGDLIVYRTCM